MNKVDGLWYDELVMYNQAVQNNFGDVLKTALLTDIHLPLYQLLLHYFGNIFSFSDYTLRVFSALIGTIVVIVGFFIGKALKNNILGLLVMGLFAINSFFIYYAQEVRMYELLALFASLNLLTLINFTKNNTKWNCFWWIISTCGLILTYTISILYVVGEIICYNIYCAKKQNLRFWISSSILFVLNIPVIFYLMLSWHKISTFVTGFYSDWSSLFVCLQNFFTPKLIGLGTNPVHYVAQFVNNLNAMDFLFVCIPLLISIYYIIRAFIKDKTARLIFSVAGMFFLIEILAFISTDFKILSRYLIVILPNLIVVIAIGMNIEIKKITNILLISAIFLINIVFLITSNEAAYKIPRVGFIPVVNLLVQSGVQNNDTVIIWNRKDILSKYLDKKVQIFSILKDFAYTSEVILANENILKSKNENEKKQILKDYFSSNEIPQNTQLIMQFIINKMKPHQKLMISVYDYFDNYNRQYFIQNILDDSQYKMMTYNNLLTIKSLLDIRYICDKNLKYIGKSKKASFVIYVYQK